MSKPARGHTTTAQAPASAPSADAASDGGAEESIFDIGERVGGAFDIRSVLGEGGMGRVYEAHDVVLNRRVAIKASWKHIQQERLLSEARALACLRHPSLATLFAYGDHRGIGYAVMERIYGTTLEAYFDRRAQSQGAGAVFGVDEAIEILLPIAEVLGVLHRAGLAHRDVKPANIMLAPGGRVVLMDFGLSLPESEAASAPMMGTPAYMAPETVTGTVEPRNAHFVDIYALGVLAFELLAGEPLFDAVQPIELLKHHVAAKVPRLRDKRDDVPAALSDLVGDMLAKDPTDRPPSMDAVAWRLSRARGGAPEERFEVLIVEDEEPIAKLLERYVQRALPDAHVQHAKDAIDAMHFVARKMPHLIFLDLHMPKMSGVELGMYLRGSQVTETCTIIAVSAGASAADRELLCGIGITRFVEKGTPGLGERVAGEAKSAHALFRTDALRAKEGPPSLGKLRTRDP